MPGALEGSGRSAARPAVAILGAGWVSHHCYGPALAQAGMRLSVVADPDLEAARGLVEQAGEGQAVARAEDLLRCPADLVVIATPNALHAALSRSALAAGFRVLCEKPLALTRADVEDLLMDGSDALAASCPYRFREDVQALAGLARSGDLGEIYRVRLSWNRARGVPRPGSWYTQRRISGGGVLADLGPHLIDLALLLTGHPRVLEVAAWTGTLLSGSHEYASSWMSAGPADGRGVVDVEDQASVLLKLATGVAEIHVSWAGHRGCDCTRLEVEGTRGRAVLKTLLGYSTEDPASPPHLEVSRAGGATSREFRFERKPAADFGRMLRAHLDGSGFPGVATGQQALAVVDVIERAYAAGR